ncbi:unnamed protein product [Phaedon cochleariae]|uniref:Endonuclease-reverse transcriptase n=1 Tax=Phaedon cochleariae TaxID=80249 RepID=A0A9N9X4L7_PHACE|nr:unnamed protein product [Phaedon cochleariae]
MAKNLKELNARVEELAGQFEKGLEEIKKSYTEDTSDTGPRMKANSNTNEIVRKFEEKMLSSLRDIKNQISTMQKEIDANKSKLDNLILDQNKNTLVIHGIDEKSTNIYEEVLNVFTNIMHIQIEKTNINQCYRIGQKSQRKQPRPIVVEFTQCWIRDQLFYAKSKLKGSRILITEKLSRDTLEIFKKVKAVMGNTAWTQRGVVYLKIDGNKIPVHTEEEWKGIQKNIEDK